MKTIETKLVQVFDNPTPNIVTGFVANLLQPKPQNFPLIEPTAAVEISIPIPAGTISCSISFILRLGPNVVGVYRIEDDLFNVKTEYLAKSMAADGSLTSQTLQLFPVPSKIKNYATELSVPKPIGSAQTVRLTISTVTSEYANPFVGASTEPFLLDNATITWSINSTINQDVAESSPPLGVNLNTTSGVIVSSLSRGMKQFGTRNKEMILKQRVVDQMGYPHSIIRENDSSTDTTSASSSSTPKGIRYVLPSTTLPATKQEPGSIHSKPHDYITTDASTGEPNGQNVAFAGGGAATVIPTSSVVGHYTNPANQTTETYRGRQLTQIALTATAQEAGTSVAVFLPPGTVRFDAGYQYTIGGEPAATEIQAALKFGSFPSSAPELTKDNVTFSPTYVAGRLFNNETLYMGTYIETMDIQYPGFISLYQYPPGIGGATPTNITGFRALFEPIPDNPFMALSNGTYGMGVAWWVRDDVAGNYETSMAATKPVESKVFVPPGTTFFGMATYMSQTCKCAFAVKMGSPPSRVTELSDEEYEAQKALQIEDDLFTRLLRGEEIISAHGGGGVMSMLGAFRNTHQVFETGTWIYIRQIKNTEYSVLWTLVCEVDADYYKSEFYRIAFGDDGDPIGTTGEIPEIYDRYHTSFTSTIGGYAYLNVSNPPSDLASLQYKFNILVDPTLLNQWVTSGGDSSQGAAIQIGYDPTKSPFQEWAKTQKLGIYNNGF